MFYLASSQRFGHISSDYALGQAYTTQHTTLMKTKNMQQINENVKNSEINNITSLHYGKS
jgi:hypothetical protein